MDNLVEFVLIGLAAGWLAGKLMKRRELDLARNLALGVLGALLGGFVFRLVGLVAYGLLDSLICATLGSMALIWLVGYFSRK